MGDKNKQVELHRDITGSIKSGEYFKDAQDWYALRFVYPTVQRGFFLLLTVVSVVTAFIAFKVFLSLLPLTTQIPLVVEVGDKATQYSVLRPIGTQTEDPNESLIKYLARHYIEIRESYDFDLLQRNLEFVKLYSNDEAYGVYSRYLNPDDNPDSPVLRFRKHTTREASVGTVQIARRSLLRRVQPGVHRVLVEFETTEQGIKGVKKSYWTAKVDLRFPDVIYYKDEERFSPLEFEVTNYEVSPAKS